jgi:hypothetical protein
MALAAVLAGNTSFYAIGQWIAGAGQKTLKALGARWDAASASIHRLDWAGGFSLSSELRS